MTLWVFGDSLSTAFNVPKESGWPFLLAQQLGMQLKNFAKPACDNSYIYHCYRSMRSQILPSDVVVIGWTHPSRRTFELNRSNPDHVAQLPNSLLYSLAGKEFIRNNIPTPDSKKKWKNFLPVSSQNPFYDTWFDNYYSSYQQRCDLESYHNATVNTCPATLLTFFFSEESIKDLAVDSLGTMLEFVDQNNCSISEDDAHPNCQGHIIWANHLKQCIDRRKKQPLAPAIELFDRLAIAEVKHEIIGENTEELNYYRAQAKYYDTSKITDELDRLKQTHKKIWNLEKELKSGKEHLLDLAEIGRRAIEIRDWNNIRVGIKNEIAELVNCPVREIKKDHLSE